MFCKLRMLALLLTLFAPAAMACSITAAGNCGGSACSAGESCTKTDEFTCKCVKNTSEKQKSKKHKKQAEQPAEQKAADPAKQ